MSDIIIQTLQIMASYVGLVFCLLMALNWMTKGWMWTFLRVKASKGKKVLTEVISKTDTYYRPGKFGDYGFQYQTRNGVKKTLADIPEDSIHQVCGVFTVTLDERKDVIYSRTKAKSSEVDAATTDSQINRALQAPELEDKKQMIMLLLQTGCLILGCITIYFLVKISDALTLLQSVSGVV